MKTGDRSHIDADTKDWGRVASDATVVKVYRNQFVQVQSESIRAVITIRKEEAGEWKNNPAEILLSFAERINPRNLGFSPKLVAIVGAIIGHDYGVRDRKGGQLTSLSITSDGYVTCGSTASDGGGAFIGSADDLDRNLEQFIMVLHNDVSDEDAEEFERVYKANVKDWRSY